MDEAQAHAIYGEWAGGIERKVQDDGRNGGRDGAVGITATEDIAGLRSIWKNGNLDAAPRTHAGEPTATVNGHARDKGTRD